MTRPGPDVSPRGSAALLAAVTVFNLVLLAPELTPVPTLHDGALHYPLVARASSAMQQGEAAIDHWNSQWVLGFPVFHYYQHLPHLAAAALDAVPGVTALGAFNFLRYALLSIFPLVLFAALRLLEMSRAAATFAAVAAPLIAAPALFGFEFESYVFGGTGLYTQLWGMLLFPLAIACFVRYAHHGVGVAASAALFALLVISHTLYGYMAAISVAALLFIDAGTPITRRAWRALAALSIAGIVVAYFVLPHVLNGVWLNRSVWEAQTKYDGYGHTWVLWRLVNGDLLDAGRWPVLTLLLGIGLAQAMARRRVADRVALMLFVVWVVLFFGRPTWGMLYRLLPMDADLHIHRFIGGVDAGALMLIGIGADAIWRAIHSRWRGIAATAVILIVLFPAFRERTRYFQWSGSLAARNAEAVSAASGEIDALLQTVSSATAERPGRVFAGLPGTWGARLTVGDIPLYALFSFHGVDVLGYAYHAMSYGADLQYHFDERNSLHYELFNVAVVVAPPEWSAPPFLQPIARAQKWIVYRAPTSGFFAVVADQPALVTRKADVYPALLGYLAHFRGFVPAPITVHAGNGAAPYRATITTSQPAHAILKMNFHPWWRATVDGREQPTVPIGPLFVGVPVAAGTHEVSFVYRPPAFKSWLAALGVVVMIAVVIGRRRIEAAIDRAPLPGAELIDGLRRMRPSPAAGVVIALALIAGLPLLQEKVLSGHDSQKYPARLAMFYDGLRAGNWVPRWAAEAAHGYGEPSLHFAPPLPGYTGSLLMAAGATPIAATNAMALGFLIAAAIGFWLIGRRLVSSEGGIIAAAAFVFAPYTLVELYARGDYSEFAAMALTPWLMLAFIDLWQRPGRHAVALAAVASAAVMLASAPATVVILSLLGATLIAVTLITGHWRSAAHAAAALALGLAIAAFYWVPAFVEKDLTHAAQMFSGWWAYTNHFVPAARLISSPWRFDYNNFPSTGQTMPLEIGPMHAVLVAVAAVAAWWYRRRLGADRRLLFAVGFAILGASLFMMTSASSFVWAAIRPLQMLQFPWRFLIGVAAGTAVCASALALPFDHPTTQSPRRGGPGARGSWAARVMAALAVAAFAVNGLPHAKAGAFLKWTADDFVGARLRQPGLELTSLGEFRPLTAAAAPTSAAAQPAQVVSGTATIQEVAHAPARRAFRVEAAMPSVIQINVLMFPGWIATVDGAAVDVRASRDRGVIELDVLAGSHEVIVRFGHTPIRTTASAISAAALVTALALCVAPRRRREDVDRA